jgi:putative ATP-binding cassette transporter
MQAFPLLFRLARGIVWIAVGVGLLNGACHAGLIAVMNAALQGTDASLMPLAWRFVGLGAVSLISGAVAALLLFRFAQQTIAEVRLELSRTILGAALRQVETVGHSRLMAALTDDVHMISQALLIFPAIALNGAVLLACAVYLCWLSWTIFLPMLGGVLFGIVGYHALAGGAVRWLRRVREEQDVLYRHFRALTEGFKELKLYRHVRTAFLHEHLQPTIAALQHYNIAASVRFVMAEVWSLMLLFGLIGGLLFALPQIDRVSHASLSGYVLTAIYMMRPLGMVLRHLPVLASGRVALRKIASLGLSLAPTPEPAVAPCRKHWRGLVLRGVTYKYQGEGEDRPFTLGPLDLTLSPGELVFLVGGNGSGKTTLAKLLCGLYQPDAGEIMWDGAPVGAGDEEAYRQLFAVVFADCYLFDRLLGLSPTTADAEARDYLVRLRLDHRVRVHHGVLSTTDLSQGQRKRLALLTAYLEDRLIYIFDEWAADQDPEFRELFYTQLVPDLRHRGKSVVVISHDTRYYPLADRVLTLRDGQLVSCSRDDA